MANKVTIQIEAMTNQAQSEIDDLRASIYGLEKVQNTTNATFKNGQDLFKKIGDAAFAFNNIVSAGKQVVGEIGKVYDATIGKAAAYADQVEGLSRLTGAATEESSKLISVADKLGISYEQLSGVLEYRARKGLDTSIAGIARLADEYNLLNPGLDQANFLMQEFGRSGADLGELMEQGAAGIRDLADATNKYLLLTRTEIENAKKLKIAQTELNDQMEVMGITLGNDLIPPLTWFIEKSNDLNKSIDANNQTWMHFVPGLNVAAQWFALLHPAAEEYTDAVDVLSANYEGMAARMRTTNEEQKEYNAQIGAATLAMAENEEATRNMNAAHTEEEALFKELNRDMQKYSEQLLFQIASEGLSAQEARELARAMGLLDEQSVAATDSMAVLKEQLDSGAITYETYLAEVKKLQDALDYLASHPYVVQVGVAGVDSSQFSVTYNGKTIAGEREEGGPVMAGQAYLVGEGGPEVFVPNSSGTIIPNQNSYDQRIYNFNYSGNVTAQRFNQSYEMARLFR